MSGGHAHVLYRDGNTPLHRMAPQCKVAALFLFVLAVVATPREAFWAYGFYALSLLVVARFGEVPLGFIARKLAIELPFVLFAVFLPFIGQGPRTEVAGLSLSIEGLWAAWNILIKATLGLTSTIILGATTPLPDLLRGLERLRMPRVITAIAAFMIRYLDVISEEMSHMRIARESRGYDPRWIWQVKALASTAGTLFIRSYERGERVYLAMVSRGYSGALPELEDGAASRASWAAAFSLPAFAVVVALTAWVSHP